MSQKAKESSLGEACLKCDLLRKVAGKPRRGGGSVTFSPLGTRYKDECLVVMFYRSERQLKNERERE